MFQTSEREPLDEQIFEDWLEKGREDRFGFHYMIILWNEWDKAYKPMYTSSRNEALQYRTDSRESVISVYDLFSESRIQ